jgi:hypothetical protein
MKKQIRKSIEEQYNTDYSKIVKVINPTSIKEGIETFDFYSAVNKQFEKFSLYNETPLSISSTDTVVAVIVN